jgi:hypothetical protein
MSYQQQYNRTHQAKNRFKNNNNQRNNSSRQNHLNSSLYGIPTTDKNEKEEDKIGLTICGGTSAVRSTMATIGGRNTNISTDPSSTDVSHMQKQVPQVKRGNDAGNNASIISSGNGNGYQKVTVAIPGCKPQSFTVCVGNDPKDVQKWIQERRANYPTRAKILLKEQQKQATATDNATTYSTPTVSFSQIPNTSNDNANSLNASTETNNYLEKSILGSLLAGYDSSSSTGSKDEIEKDKKDDYSAVHRSGLSFTESTTETITLTGENMKAPSTIIESSVSSNSNTHFDKKLCRYFLRGKCFRGKECTFLHDDIRRVALTEVASESEVRPLRDGNRNAKRCIEEQQLPENVNKQGTHQKKKKTKHTSSTTCTNTTLLRKLLDNDIKREACITLQLLRYIVQSNFFDDQTTQKPE